MNNITLVNEDDCYNFIYLEDVYYISTYRKSLKKEFILYKGYNVYENKKLQTVFHYLSFILENK